MTTAPPWRVEVARQTVAELHARDVPDVPERILRWCYPTDVAVVLGRSQDASVLDTAVLEELGVDIVRRNSGGGMVFVEPTSMHWFDVVVPRGDPLWTEDVTVAFHWLGEAIARALIRTTSVEPTVHKAEMQRGLFAREVCFLSLGPGELIANGKKIVGISQRRRREGAVFHCSVLTAVDAQDVTDLTVLGKEAKKALGARLQDFVGWIEGFDTEAFERVLLEELDRL